MIQKLNDYRTDASEWWILGGLNVLLVLVGAGVAVALQLAPSLFLPDGVTGEAAARYVDWYLLTRNVPLAVAAVALLVLRGGHSRPSSCCWP